MGGTPAAGRGRRTSAEVRSVQPGNPAGPRLSAGLLTPTMRRAGVEEMNRIEGAVTVKTRLQVAGEAGPSPLLRAAGIPPSGAHPAPVAAVVTRNGPQGCAGASAARKRTDNATQTAMRMAQLLRRLPLRRAGREPPVGS